MLKTARAATTIGCILSSVVIMQMLVGGLAISGADPSAEAGLSWRGDATLRAGAAAPVADNLSRNADDREPAQHLTKDFGLPLINRQRCQPRRRAAVLRQLRSRQTPSRSETR